VTQQSACPAADYTAAKYGHNGRKGRRAAFFLCFAAGLLLMLACIAGAAVYNARRADLFQYAVDHYVVAAGVMDQDSADRFVARTMGYLNGDLLTWEPNVTVNGQPLTVPETFLEHMAQVRTGIRFTRAAVVAAAALALALLLGSALTGRGRGCGCGFSARGYTLGALVPLLAAAGLGLWGLLDFNALWAWLHYTFIPGGIFNAREPVMRLFPEALFTAYIRPVALSLAWGAAVLLLWPLAARALHTAVKRSRSTRGFKGR